MTNIATWGAMRRIVSQPPWLICLGARRRFVTPGHPMCVPDGHEVADHILEWLQFARAEAWRVAHIATRGNESRVGDGLDGALAGVEPRVREPMYIKSGPSVFTAHEMFEHARDVGPAEIFLVGLAPALDFVATALDAQAFGWPLTIVEDAFGSPSLSDRDEDETRNILAALIAPIAKMVSTDAALRVRHVHEV